MARIDRLVPEVVLEAAQALSDMEEAENQPKKGDGRGDSENELPHFVGQQQHHAFEADGRVDVPQA